MSQALEACATRAKDLGERLPGWPGRFAAHRVAWNSCLLRQAVPRTVALARDLLAFAERGGDPVQLAATCRAVDFVGVRAQLPPSGVERRLAVWGIRL